MVLLALWYPSGFLPSLPSGLLFLIDDCEKEEGTAAKECALLFNRRCRSIIQLSTPNEFLHVQMGRI